MAARLFRKNQYETWDVIYDNIEDKSSEKASKVFQEREKAKNDQDNGITFGGLQRIHYTRYWHDPSPLFLSFSYINADIRCFVGINLHYMLTSHARLILKTIKANNVANIKMGRTLVVTYDMVKGLGLPIVAYRNYKYDFTRPIEYIPMDEWEETVIKERSIWQGKFYGMSQIELDKLKKEKNKRAKKRRKSRKR